MLSASRATLSLNSQISDAQLAQAVVFEQGLHSYCPTHPLLTCIDGEDLVEVLESYWVRTEFRNTCSQDSVSRAVTDAGLAMLRTSLLADALVCIQARQREGWVGGRWKGGEDLKFLNVTEYRVSLAYKTAARRMKWSASQAQNLLSSLESFSA